MAKRWCVFFALVLVVAAETLVSLHFGTPQAWAQDAPTGAAAPGGSAAGRLDTDPSGEGLSPEFSNLPAFDVTFRKAFAAQIRVGDTLELKVSGELPPDPSIASGPGYGLKVPPGTHSLFDEGWNVRLLPASMSDRAKSEIWFKANPLRPGKLSLPSLGITDSTGRLIARTNPMPVEVASAISKDDPKAQESIEPTPVPLEFPRAWLWGGLIVLVLALSTGGVWVWKKIKARRQAERAPLIRRLLSEDEFALQALDQLETQGWIQRGQHKKHYFGISEIFKRYLGARYSVDALESTTGEIMRLLDETHLVGTQQAEEFKRLLDQLDLVKFTDIVPSILEGKELAAEARRLISISKRPAPIREPDAV